MKVSLNWIKEYTDISMSVDELVKKIGSQLGEVEEVISLADVYKDIYSKSSRLYSSSTSR